MPEFGGLELARRLEAAHAWRGVEYARAQAILHPDWPVAVQGIAGGFAIYVSPGSPANKVTGIGLHGPVSTRDWEQIEEFCQQHDCAPHLDLCPLADPSVIQRLRERGYQLEGFLNVLACRLPDDIVALPQPPGVEVTRAIPEAAEVWIRTTAQGFEATETPSPESLDILAPNFYAENAVPFLARVDGQPAGGGSLLLHEGVAEFGGDSTRVAFRGRGVHRALLLARLAAARELGCDLAMVLTEPGSQSQRNAECLGFRVVYTNAILVRA